MSTSPNAPAAKRFMRLLWKGLPRTSATFDIGKLITRSILKPESGSLPVEIQLSGHIPMRLDLSSFVANDLYCLDDHYESVTLRLWRKLSRDAKVILDVGSHIGTFALVSAEANSGARIVCVEADGNIYKHLKLHAERYPNILAVQAAIADSSTSMWFCPVGGNDGGGFLTTTKPEDNACYPVTTHTLLTVCREHNVGSIDLMKLDVEGFEYELLTRNDDFFMKHSPKHLLVELRRDHADPQKSDEIFAAMKRRGYDARRIQGLYAIPFGKDHDLANWHFEKTRA